MNSIILKEFKEKYHYVEITSDYQGKLEFVIERTVFYQKVIITEDIDKTHLKMISLNKKHIIKEFKEKYHYVEITSDYQGKLEFVIERTNYYRKLLIMEELKNGRETFVVENRDGPTLNRKQQQQIDLYTKNSDKKLYEK